jgi:hypothetical protein
MGLFEVLTLALDCSVTKMVGNLPSFVERTQKHHAALGQEWEQFQSVDRKKMMKECRKARAVICHQYGQTRPHLQSTYLTLLCPKAQSTLRRSFYCLKVLRHSESGLDFIRCFRRGLTFVNVFTLEWFNFYIGLKFWRRINVMQLWISA